MQAHTCALPTLSPGVSQRRGRVAACRRTPVRCRRSHLESVFFRHPKEEEHARDAADAAAPLWAAASGARRSDASPSGKQAGSAAAQLTPRSAKPQQEARPGAPTAAATGAAKPTPAAELPPAPTRAAARSPAVAVAAMPRTEAAAALPRAAKRQAPPPGPAAGLHSSSRRRSSGSSNSCNICSQRSCCSPLLLAVCLPRRGLGTNGSARYF